MFYAHFVLSKKGPLAKIWLAAHWDKKLTKAHIFETDIEGSVEAIIQPKVKLALRTSGHLLLGVVRIYSRKTKYLLADCNEALVKIKMAFRPGMVDLPEDNREAAVAAITLPENFYDFENMMVDLAEFELPPQYNINQSRPEEITMQEVDRGGSYIGDDGFGDIEAYNLELSDINLDDPLCMQSVRLPNETEGETQEGATDLMDIEPEKSDVEMADKPEDRIEVVEAPDSEIPLPVIEPLPDDLSDYEGPAGVEDDDSDHEGGQIQLNSAEKSNGLFEEPESISERPQIETAAPLVPGADVYEHQEQDASPAPESAEQVTLAGIDQTTLITNEAEAFALMPIDVTNVGTERKAKKKRKLIVDELKAISSEAMKVQLSSGSDLITLLDLAPPTKKLMKWKDCGGVDRLMVLPARTLPHKKLNQLYTANLRTCQCSDEEEKETEQPKEPKKQSKMEKAGVVNKKSAIMSKRVVEDEASVLADVEDEVSVLADVEKARRGSAAESTSHQNEDLHISIASNLQTSKLPIDDTFTNSTSAHLDESPAYAPSQAAAPIPHPELNMPSLSLGDMSLPALESMDEMPRMADESLSASILEPRSHMSEWMGGGGEDDLDETVFNENVHTVARNDNATDFMEGEEEEDEHVCNKRTSYMLKMLQPILNARSSIGARFLFARNNRKQVASKFYTLLVLNKLCVIDVQQEEPYGDISITKGPAFDAVR